MRYSAPVFILLAAFAIPTEAAQPVAVVLSQPIDASEIEGAKQLANLIQQRLLDSYAQKHGLEPTEAELRPLLRSFEEAGKKAEESMKRVRKQRVEEIRKKLEAPALDPAERAQLTASLADWERSPTGQDAKAREGERMAVLLVQNWKVQRSLYRRYGGRVLVSSFGFHVAIDAMKQFFQEEEKRGSFAIPDPDLRAAFWTALADETWADGVTSGRGAEDVFATPPWQAEERRP
jgi:hypothetical protein